MTIDVISLFKQEKIGRVLIENGKESLCLFSKKDLIVSLIKNFNDKKRKFREIDESIEELEKHVKLMIKADEIITIQRTNTIYEALLILKTKAVDLTDFFHSGFKRKQLLRWVFFQASYHDDNGKKTFRVRLIKRFPSRFQNSSLIWSRKTFKTK